MRKQKKVKKTPDQKLTDLALTMMQQLKVIDKHHLRESRTSIQEKYGDKIWKKLLLMSPGKRGEIAELCAGVFMKDFLLPENPNGKNTVTYLAFQTICARMNDLLQEDQRRLVASVPRKVGLKCCPETGLITYG